MYTPAGGGYTAAAQELMLHKNTVQYRIRKAEQARGRPLADGRLDVEVAARHPRAGSDGFATGAADPLTTPGVGRAPS
jgi:DNA-binding PucR family transcriptional regulator